MDGGAYAVLFNLVPRGKVETTLVLGMKTEAFMLITPISFVFVSGDVLLWVEKFFFLHGPFWGSLFYSRSLCRHAT